MASHVNDTGTDSTDCDALEVLGDECARTILVASSDRPRTAKELTAITDSSSATVYRRINSLLECDLLAECVRFDEDGSHSTAYETTVEHLSIEIGAEGIDVSAADSDTLPGLAARLDQVPIDAVEAGIEEDYIDIRIPVDDESVEQALDGEIGLRS